MTASSARTGRPTLAMRARDLTAGAAPEALVLAGAVPFLFLHATYQPTVSIGLASTTVDVTLADDAIAAVVAAAALRTRREGLAPLRAARWILGAAAVLLALAFLALATPSVLDEEYALAPHAVSALKFAWYALLLPATVLLVRSAADARALFRAVVLWSVVATSGGLLQFLGLVSEFEGKRPGQREPSFVGIHDFATLSGAALTLGLAGLVLADGRPLGGRRWTTAALVTGALGVVLSGALTAVGGIWLATAALLLFLRALWSARRLLGVAAIVLAVTAGTTVMRAETIERFAEFIGLRDRIEETRVESYAHRTLLAYIGARIWLDHPVAGVGWQASDEEWAYTPYLADARERFPDEPDQAFPSPEHPWGVQSLYVQVLADLGVVGFAALVALFAAGVGAALRAWGVWGRRTPGDRPLQGQSPALIGLAWLLVTVGVWAGIGLVAGLPLAALTWIALGLVGVHD